jgi:ribosomal protein L10
LVTLENVSSNQIQMIRRDLGAAGAELVIGKNTVVKKALDIRANPLKAD